jgi:hypothetical protein
VERRSGFIDSYYVLSDEVYSYCLRHYKVVDMKREDLFWARDVALVLQQRRMRWTANSSNDRTDKLIDALLSDPLSKSWEDVIDNWTGTTGNAARNPESTQRQVRRVRDLLTRAASGLNPDNLKGAVRFQNRTRASNMLVLAQLLADHGHKSSSDISYESVLQIATVYELPDIALIALTHLRFDAAVRYNRKAVQHYDALVRKMHAMLSIQTEADTLLSHAAVLLLEYTSQRTRTASKLRDVIDRLKMLAKLRAAPSLVQMHRYRVQIWLSTLEGDAQRIFKTGSEALTYIDKHRQLEHSALRAELLGSQLSATLLIGDTQAAKNVWQTASTMVSEGGDGWSSLLHVYFLTCSTHGSYREARDSMWLYQNKRKSTNKVLRDHTWSICRAYIMLLIDTGRIDAGPFQHCKREYLASIERRHDNYVGDKAITSASLYILRILQWLRTYKYSEVVANGEAIRQYAARHLNNPNTLRTGVFFRMLATLPAADFNPDEVERRGNVILAKYPKAARLQRDYAEIIPYQELWAIVLETLRQRGEARRR